MTDSQIVEITQSIIAILVVAIGGVAVLTGSTHIPDIAPFIALVFGYYFGKVVQVVQNGSGNKPKEGNNG